MELGKIDELDFGVDVSAMQPACTVRWSIDLKQSRTRSEAKHTGGDTGLSCTYMAGGDAVSPLSPIQRARACVYVCARAIFHSTGLTEYVCPTPTCDF